LGALTSKNFPFELRSWEVENFKSLDPTDGLGLATRIYVNKNQVIQIEPEYNIYNSNVWLTDKGRQFFDSVFGSWSQQNSNKPIQFNSNFWANLTKTIIKTFYLVDQSKKTSGKTHFFTIVFENLSLEILSFLITVTQRYSFINLRRAENFNTKNDLETDFQLNITTNKFKLLNSTLCLLISNNPRYESYFLNLSLRQRMAKGNFKCFVVGSLIDLTFPVIFLGSNLNVLKNIFYGNSLICQSLKKSKKPLTIYNNELLKRKDGNAVIEMAGILKYANVFSKTWNNLDKFSSTLSETGIQSMSKFSAISKKDLQSFGLLYFLNVTPNNLTNLKQIVEFKLLNSKKKSTKINSVPSIYLEQSLIPTKIFNFYSQLYQNIANKKYFYVPSTTLYENEETFINIEGLIKRTNKIIFKDNTVNNWQLLRKLFKHFHENINFIENKNNLLVFLNSKEIIKFKNFIYFQYQATQSLVNLNFYLIVKNQPFIILNENFKRKTKKLFLTKLKYWLDDFYSGGKDEYSKSSFNMSNCSKLLRSKVTNFF
jgi:NADH dehydrogenase/NADH:ubiquinone oxidoreductase subunit G